MPGINFSAYRIHFLCCWPYEFGPLDSNFARFCFILPLQISLISWPIGRPPAERRGVQGGDPPAKAKRLLLKYFKKSNYYLRLGATFGGVFTFSRGPTFGSGAHLQSEGPPFGQRPTFGQGAHLQSRGPPLGRGPIVSQGGHLWSGAHLLVRGPTFGRGAHLWVRGPPSVRGATFGRGPTF